jgi:hypothetical protein
MSILYLIPVWFVLGLLIPAAWSIGKVYRRSRNRRAVVCPEIKAFALIQVDARHAAAMHILGNPVRQVQSCSRWPGRRSCDRACLLGLAPAA